MYEYYAETRLVVPFVTKGGRATFFDNKYLREGFEDLRKLSPQKKIGPQMAFPKNSHICGRSANLTDFLSHKFADSRIAEPICGAPTFGSYICNYVL